ncbi:MAG TPA: hypothetical protein VL357_03340 [Rariglobus sp.]|nr:hypothetical protein [Rariglobus sp.]
MITHKIRSAQTHFGHIPNGENIVLGVIDSEALRNRINQAGFPYPLQEGLSLLPAANRGKACRENAEGWFQIHRDRPKETAYRTVRWHWRMKRGDWYEDQERDVDVPYQRYPRTFHNPYSMELTVRYTASGETVIVLPHIVQGQTSQHQLKTAVNLLIELFGSCEVMNNNLERLMPVEVQRINWEVLPPGEMPFEQLRAHLEPSTRNESQNKRDMILRRFQVLNSYQPDARMVGRHGFSGYVIFVYTQRNLVLLENARYGNASYGLGSNWETLSRLSKAELLNEHLHEFRYIHNAGWEDRIRELFDGRLAA